MGKKAGQEVLIVHAKYKVWVVGCGCSDEVQSEAVILGGQSRVKITWLSVIEGGKMMWTWRVTLIASNNLEIMRMGSAEVDWKISMWQSTEVIHRDGRKLCGVEW